MFNDLSKAFGKVHKRVDDLKIEKDKEIFKLKTYLESVQDTVNNLIINNKYNEEYIEALRFFTWFDWSKLNSQNLIKETKFKPLNALPTDSIDSNVDKIKKVEKLKNVSTHFSEEITAQGVRLTVPTAACYCGPANYYEYTTTCDSYQKQLVDDILEAVGKQPKKKQDDKVEKIPYDQCVGNVVDNIYKYDKKTIYKVYKYLLTILDKNKTINEYQQKYYK